MKKSVQRISLKLEGLAIFILAIALFTLTDGNWILFVILFLAPDLSFIGFSVNKAAGITTYNLFHTYTLPILLGIIAIFTNVPILAHISFIWIAHIGGDRAIGYGLKYSPKKGDTHLNKL